MTPKTEKCPQCESDEKNVLGKECRFRSSAPIHFKRAHEWHSTPLLPEQEGAAEQFAWSLETMKLINDLIPDVQGKAFDPDWFLLRNRFEEFEADNSRLQDELKRMRAENEILKHKLYHE